MPEETNRSDRTRPYEYYLLYRDRIEREAMAIDSGMKWLLAVEATSLLFAVGLTIAAWMGLAKQAEMITYNSSYAIVVVTNAVASVGWLAIHGVLCYTAGWKLTRNAETKLQHALEAWSSVIQEGEEIRHHWETKYRPTDEAFAVPSFTNDMQANGMLTIPIQAQAIRASLNLIRLMWLTTCGSGVGLWCIQLWIL